MMKLYLLKFLIFIYEKKKFLILFNILYIVVMLLLEIFLYDNIYAILFFTIYYLIGIVISYFLRLQMIVIDFVASLNKSIKIKEYKVNWIPGCYFSIIYILISIFLIVLNIITLSRIPIILIPSIFLPVMTIYSFPKTALKQLQDRYTETRN